MEVFMTYYCICDMLKYRCHIGVFMTYGSIYDIEVFMTYWSLYDIEVFM